MYVLTSLLQFIEELFEVFQLRLDELFSLGRNFLGVVLLIEDLGDVR